MTPFFSSGDITEFAEVTYNGIDNIQTKTGVGTYAYGDQCSHTSAGPHAVCRITNGSQVTNYYYDANGNMTGDNQGRSLIYSVFDKPLSITKSGHTSSFSYGPDRARFKRVDEGAEGTTTTLYAGSVEKIYYPDDSIVWKRSIAGVAVITEEVNSSGQPQSVKHNYLHYDHLGSISLITNGQGRIVEELYFDPWGDSRNADRPTEKWVDTSPFLKASKPTASRGYTGHEMLDEVGLVHMNGRIYDAKIARFVQADPIIQDPLRVQSLNRYSYVWNNPLNAVDPSGFECVEVGGDEHRCTDANGGSEVTTGHDTCSSGSCTNYVHTDKSGNQAPVSVNDSDVDEFEKEMGDSGVSLGSLALGSLGAGAVSGGGSDQATSRMQQGDSAFLQAPMPATVDTPAPATTNPPETSPSGDPSKVGAALAKLLKLGKIGGVTISAMLASANAGDPNEQELLVAARIGYYAGFTQANEHDGDKIAVIGEEQKRVARVALQIGAIHIRPVWPEEYNYKQPMSELQKRFSVAFNEGWINGVMAANLDIVDIGRSVNYRDREVSYYYRAERQLIENRSYPYYQRRVEYDTLNFDY